MKFGYKVAVIIAAVFISMVGFNMIASSYYVFLKQDMKQSIRLQGIIWIAPGETRTPDQLLRRQRVWQEKLLSTLHQNVTRNAKNRLRLLKRKETEVLMISRSMSEVAGVPEERVEPTLTVK